MNKKSLQLLQQAKQCVDSGQSAKAADICRKLMKQYPQNSELKFIHAECLYFGRQFDDAALIFRDILESEPDHESARLYLFGCYKEGGRFTEMLRLAEQFRDHPRNPVETLSAYRAFQDLCDWEQAYRLKPTVIEHMKSGKIPQRYLSGPLLDLNTVPDISPEDMFAIHRLWGERVETACRQAGLKLPTPAAPSGKVKIGYLSVDFNKHPVGHLILPVINNHDRSRFEIFCYARLYKDDEMTSEFRNSSDHFIDITGMTLAQAATKIAEDGIHILIDLSGHTTGSPMDLMAFKPAPVQITYLGYPNTTGLSAVDFRITDHNSESESGTRYTEQLLYMPETFLCMRGLPDIPYSETTPAEKNGYITFGSFNHIRKTNPQVIQAWSAILNHTPGSKMLIKSAGCHEEIIRKNILREFARHGIDEKRIEFASYMDSYEAHAGLYNSIDIALDTFPYHGTHTTLEALWMSVPVVTLEGECHVQRVSSSILKCIGFESTVTQSPDEYINKAVELARRPENLSFLRKCIHTLFSNSAIFSPDKVTSQLEELYLKAWELKTGEKAQCGTAEQAMPSTAGVTTDSRVALAECIAAEAEVGNTVIAEVGARILDHSGASSAPEIFHQLSHATIIAFEADRDACEQINRLKNRFAAAIEAYPCALGRTGEQRTLYVTRDPMCSSLYRPNEAVLGRFEGLEVASLSHEAQIDVVSLDAFMDSEQIERIDFIKIDVQGAELDVFKGAEHTLKDVIGICTEVEFAELYENQPLFAEVDLFLRRQGFQMHHFTGAAMIPLKGDNMPGVHQHLWSDAVYFPSFERIDALSADQLARLAVMATLYDAHDLAAYALHRHDVLKGGNLAAMFHKNFYPQQEMDAVAPERTEPEVILSTAEASATATITIPGDVKIVVPNDINLMTPYVLNEQQDWFEDEIAFIRRVVRPGMKVIDIGANYGCYAMTMANLIGERGHLWAFEPASTTAGFLAESISSNSFAQVTLIKAALSDHEGTAELSLDANSELNSIAQASGSGQSETVPLKRLDDCIKAYQFREIEFVKLDAEGEEIHILDGGTQFFDTFSPLVMFEFKHGDQVNEGLIQKFHAMGYETYILAPGLQMLMPFSLSDTPDGYLLNLFGCKPDRAAALAEQGLLATALPDQLPLPESGLWCNQLERFAYSQPLMEAWQAQITQQPLPGWEHYEQALDAWARAHSDMPPEIRLAALQHAFITLVSLLDVYMTIPRMLTLARIATDLGKRSVAVQLLNQIVHHFDQESTFYPNEPFLAPSPQAEASDPGEHLADWCLAWALAERERLHAFSSYFAGQSSLADIERFLAMGFEDDEMLRRRALIRERFGLTSATPAIAAAVPRPQQRGAPEWIFVVGMPRSGSTWCYNVVRKLMEINQCGSAIGFVGEGELLDTALNRPGDQNRPRLIKFHIMTPTAQALLKSGAARAIYSQRDLRDVVVSLMEFEQQSFEDVAEVRLEHIMESHRQWKSAPNTVCIEYGNITDSAEQTIAAIAQQIGIDADEKSIRQIAEACSIDKAKASTISLLRGENRGDHIKQLDNHRSYDTNSLLHANHISSGKSGRYRDKLSPSEIDSLNRKLQGWLSEEGYASGA